MRIGSRSRCDAYMESRDAIGQLAQPAADFVDFDDLRTSQPAVEHVYPLEHWQRVDGGDGPCTRFTGLDGELARQLLRSVPARSASFKQNLNSCDPQAMEAMERVRCKSGSAHRLAKPLAKQTRYGFFLLWLTSNAKP